VVADLAGDAAAGLVLLGIVIGAQWALRAHARTTARTDRSFSA
jgi:hypothetical protein